MNSHRRYTVTMSPDQLSGIAQEWGRQAVADRKPFLMLRFVGEKGRELPQHLSCFPDRDTPDRWTLHTVGGDNTTRFKSPNHSRFDITSEAVLDELEEAVYCGPVQP